jgi:hypothetical protein
MTARESIAADEHLQSGVTAAFSMSRSAVTSPAP